MQTINEYGGFKIDKNELPKLFFIIYNNPKIKNKELESESGLGKNKVENFKYYLKNFNLLDKNYNPTDLAKVIYTYDKYFEDEFTLWLFFYHWAEKTSNPFLYFLLNESFDSKTEKELHREFCGWAVNNDIKTDYEKDFVKGLILRTVNSFIDHYAFKSLNIFKLESEKYTRDIPYKTSPLLFGYILYDSQNGRTTISFEELLKEPNNIGKIFNMSRENLLQQIYNMRDVGIVEYNQTANLQLIVFTYKGTALELLERYYEQY